MSGWLRVVGLGPGAPGLRTPEASSLLEAASDLVGYWPYLDRVPERSGQVRHRSGNREELARARAALALAEAGRRVAVVSSGDPGVFAMASAVFEAIAAGPPSWRALDVAVAPGVSALLAAAARLGAPLGGDFCAISLSDNLKSWDTLTRRLLAAAGAGFAMALYNPASAARPWQLGAAFALLREVLPGTAPVAFARGIGAADERIEIADLASADPAWVDMRTLVLVGSAATRRIARQGGGEWLYAPRAESMT